MKTMDKYIMTYQEYKFTLKIRGGHNCENNSRILYERSAEAV